MKGENITKKINGTIRNNITYEDFKKVFSVFESYPYFEKFPEQDLIEEYQSFQNGGYSFGYYTEEGECVAIITMNPYKHDEHPVDYPKNLKVMYISNLATMFEYRNQGIATKLFKHTIQNMEEMGYDYIYYRTKKENSMSYSIGKKFGFIELPNIIEYVDSKQTDGSVIKDPRIFLEKKLSK